MTSDRALAADVMMRYRGQRNPPGNDVLVDAPARGTNGKGNNAPAGGNHPFADGSGSWINYEDTYHLHSRSSDPRVNGPDGLTSRRQNLLSFAASLPSWDVGGFSLGPRGMKRQALCAPAGEYAPWYEHLLPTAKA